MMGSQWEAQLITPNVLQAAGFNPSQPFAGDPTTLTMASPLRGMNNRVRTWGKQQLDTAMRLKDTCILDDQQPEPDSLIGLARQAEQLFPQPNQKDPNYPALIYQRDQAMHQWIREQFHTSVIAHEMGHSMGLRHNFTGSWDALNYHTEYWQLRTRNGQEHYCGYPGPLDATTPHTNGTDCVGPRWVDPVTDQETNDLIWKWASTTVMDYPGDQTQDMNDIGNYDKAAMRFGYANVVDVETTMQYGQQDGATAGSGADYLSLARRLRRHLGHVDRAEPLQHVRGQVRHPRQVQPEVRLERRPERSARAAVHGPEPRLRGRARHEDGAEVRHRHPLGAARSRGQLRRRHQPARRVRQVGDERRPPSVHVRVRRVRVRQPADAPLRCRRRLVRADAVSDLDVREPVHLQQLPA